MSDTKVRYYTYLYLIYQVIFVKEFPRNTCKILILRYNERDYA